MGKGSNRRPAAIPEAEWQRNYDRIFKKPAPPKEKPPEPKKPDGQ